jgi:hypothetical protein
VRRENKNLTGQRPDRVKPFIIINIIIDWVN